MTRSGAFVTLRNHLWIVLGGTALLLLPGYILMNRFHHKKHRQAAYESEEAPDVQIFFKKDEQ